MKGTESFNQAIKEFLDAEAERDPLFAVTLKKPNKSLDECVLYIIQQVHNLGASVGLTSDEVYGMAKHYYDEDDISVGEDFKKNVRVVVARKGSGKPKLPNEVNKQKVEEQLPNQLALF